MLTEHLIRSKASEALGYWTAKFEIMKQNKENVKTRTTNKEANKTKIKKWMKTMKPDKCRIKALTKLGIKDRTYLTYVHEIHEENNARIRNAKTTILRRNVVSAKH